MSAAVAAQPPQGTRILRGVERRAPWILAGMLVVAAALRLAEARATPLWFDEIYVTFVARRPMLEVLRIARLDIHPPLQFVFRRWWVLLGGDGELWMKSLSVLLGLGSILATYRLGKRIGGVQAGLIAAALLTLNGSHIHFSQEVEVYAFLWVLLPLAVGAGWSFVEEGRPAEAAWFVGWALVAIYTDYLAAFVLGAMGLWGLFALGDGARRGRWLLLYALIALLCLPWVPALIEQFHREGSGKFFRFPAPGEIAALWGSVGFGVKLLVPVLASLALIPLFRAGQRRAAVLLWLVCTLPELATRAWPFVVRRDDLYVMMFFYPLVAAGAMALRGRWTGWAVATLLLLVGARAWMHHQPYEQPRALKQAENLLRSEHRPGDLLINAESNSLLYFRYHMPQARSVLLMPAGKRAPHFDAGLVIPDAWYLSPEQWARERERGVPWWCVRVDRAFATAGVVTRAGAWVAALANSLPVERKWEFPPVTVWKGRVGRKPR